MGIYVTIEYYVDGSRTGLDGLTITARRLVDSRTAIVLFNRLTLLGSVDLFEIVDFWEMAVTVVHTEFREIRPPDMDVVRTTGLRYAYTFHASFDVGSWEQLYIYADLAQRRKSGPAAPPACA